MSTTCKWEYYCNIQKQRAKTSCLSLRAQMRAFEEEMLAVQWTARQNQIRIEYELCVAACGCTQCSCETECINTRNTTLSFFQRQYNTDLAAIAERYTCCDEQYCTQEGDTAYQICCDTNGPIGTAGRPDTATYAGIFTPTLDLGDRGIPVVANFLSAKQPFGEINYDRPVNCVNVLITTSRTCQNAAWEKWFAEDQRIKQKFKTDNEKCSAEHRACKDPPELCNAYWNICLDNAQKEEKVKTEINNTEYEAETGYKAGDTIPQVEIPGARNPPWVDPPCHCCRKADQAYKDCVKKRDGLNNPQINSMLIGYPY